MNNQKIKTVQSIIKDVDGPNFLCIGAPRAGTTWLHRMLSKHPDIYVTPIKELHYFNNLDKETGEIQLQLIGNNRIWEKWFYNKYYFFYRKKILINLKSFQINFHQFIWYLKLFFSKTYNLKWYVSLFPSSGMVKGELTPGYSILEENTIKIIKEMNPDIKIIYILRNPIGRCKSAVRKKIKKKKLSINRKVVIEVSQEKMNEPLNDYFENLSRYYSIFPKEQILVLFFDELLNNPQEYLDKVTSFLGVKAVKIQSTVLRTKVNSNPKVSFPPEAIKLLSEHFLPQLYQLKQLYPSKYIDQWITDLETKLVTLE